MTSIRPNLLRPQRVVPAPVPSDQRDRVDLKNQQAYLESVSSERNQLQQQTQNAYHNAANSTLNKYRAQLSDQAAQEALLKKWQTTAAPLTRIVQEQSQSPQDKFVLFDNQAQIAQDILDNDHFAQNSSAGFISKREDPQDQMDLVHNDYVENSSTTDEAVNQQKFLLFLNKNNDVYNLSAPKLAGLLLNNSSKNHIEGSLGVLTSRLFGEMRALVKDQHSIKGASILHQSYLLRKVRLSLSLVKKLRSDFERKGTYITTTDDFVATKLLEETDSGCHLPQRFAKSLFGPEQGVDLLEKHEVVLCLRHFVSEVPVSWWAKASVRLSFLKNLDELIKKLNPKTAGYEQHLIKRFRQLTSHHP